MANKFFPMLPQLNEDAAINPDKASAWEKETGTRDFLLALVKSLAVGGSIKDMGSIDSIPDVWARPLLFQMALYDDQRSSAQEFVQGLHDKVKGEWRAMLAMLALKNVRHLALTAEPVHLGTGTSGLERVLAGLAPTDSISRSTGWSDIYIIHYQGKPLGLTSPTTLVAPAADYQRTMEGIITQPWSADGKTLCDPIPYLTVDELGALYSWLQQVEKDLRETIPTAEQDESQACLSLFGALESYQEDIRHRSNQLPSMQLVSADLGLNIGIFRCLNQSVEAKAADAGDSAVRLIPSPGRGKAGEIILVSPQMVRDYAAQEGVPAAQLVVWPGLSANDVTEESLKEDRSRIGNVSLGKAAFRRPEDFFTNSLTLMESGKAFAGTMKVPGMMELLEKEEMSPILPLRAEILEYFTPQEIAQRTRIEKLKDRINVQFAFPLAGVNGNSEFKYVKSYPNDKINYLQSRVPVLELWPNIKRKGWNKYYLYYENSEAQNVSSQELGRDLFYVYPLKYGEEIVEDMPEKGLANLYTAKLTGFPEALRCTVNVEAENSIYAQQVEGGILLLNEPPTVQAVPRLEWQVGIDFGTSSTMLYYREGAKKPLPLVLEPHLLPVTGSNDTDRIRTFVNFIPSKTSDQQDGSFLSIFHMLDSSNVKTEIRPLQDGHVFWLRNVNSSDFSLRSQQIDANLKWKNDDVGRRKVAAYVKQICLQSLVEAAAAGAETVKWNFSYPTAFSAEQKFAFKATCQEAVQESYEDTGLEQSGEMCYWPESKAAAYHFNKLGTNATNFGEGAICLDIGAGTTDISIISGQPARIVYHTSIQYAGRYLFKPIYRNYELFKGDSLDIGDMDEEHRNAVIDADMRENSELYLKNLKNLTGRKEIKKVLQEVQLGMAGIFCYLGSILKVLSEKGIYTEKHLPDIYVGGNGSRVFYWLCGGTFDSGAPFLGVFQEMLSAYSSLEKGYGANIHLSVHPKVEVAGGMIEQRPHNDVEFFDEERQVEELFGEAGKDEYIAAAQISGDCFVVKGEAHESHDFMSAYDIANGVEIENVEALENFLEEFNKNRHIWFEGVNFDEDKYHDIARRVKSHYVNQLGMEPKKVFVEPVFILEMKECMEMLANV